MGGWGVFRAKTIRNFPQNLARYRKLGTNFYFVCGVRRRSPGSALAHNSCHCGGPQRIFQHKCPLSASSRQQLHSAFTQQQKTQVLQKRTTHCAKVKVPKKQLLLQCSCRTTIFRIVASVVPLKCENPRSQCLCLVLALKITSLLRMTHWSTMHNAHDK